MKQIPLTQGQFTTVDDEDYDFLMQWKWYAQYCKSINSFYAVRAEYISSKRIKISLHRFIMNVNDRYIDIDHRNHNTLDNQKLNLRVCTRSENVCNARPYKNTSSKYKGIAWSEPHNKWRARICKNYKSIQVGMFHNEIEAAKAYDKKALELFGEFANINFK